MGEVILDFSWKDGWYPATDGEGHSLVARSPGATPVEALDEAAAWAISQSPGGSPGESDTAFASSYYGWDNFHFTEAERNDPLISGPNADPDGDGRANFMEYALATNPRVRDTNGLMIRADAALLLRRPRYPLDIVYALEAGQSAGLTTWQSTPYETTSVILDGETESVAVRETSPPVAARRFLRLRCTLQQ